MAQIFCENEATFSPRDITNAVDTMKWQIPLMGEASRHLVGFANGVYDLNAKTFRAHKAEDWLTTHNGISYTPPLPGETPKAHAPIAKSVKPLASRQCCLWYWQTAMTGSFFGGNRHRGGVEKASLPVLQRCWPGSTTRKAAAWRHWIAPASVNRLLARV